MKVGRPAHRRLAAWLFIACGVWLLGLGFYFIFIRPALLPEDLRYMGTDAQALKTALPGLALWLGKVFTVMGGFMAGTGVMVSYIGWRELSGQPRAAVAALALTGLLTVGLMSAVNFALRSDYRWLLAVPCIFWSAAVIGCIGKRTP